MMKGLLFILLLVAVSASAEYCHGTAGRFCEQDETCCMLSNGTVGYCCPAKLPLCCGSAICCSSGSQCIMNCTSENPTCSPSTKIYASEPAPLVVEFDTPILHFDDGACDLSSGISKCCGPHCCKNCCLGPNCQPDGDVCCDDPASYFAEDEVREGSAAPSQSQSKGDPLTWQCTHDYPMCCPGAENGTCCHANSSCCTDGSCPADSTCCGNCNCCNLKTQICREDTGACERISTSILIPTMVCIWGIWFFGNIAYLASRYIEQLALKREVSTMCLDCFHEPHCLSNGCSHQEINSSKGCVQCSQHCQRTECHRSRGSCGQPYMAQERMVHKGTDTDRETVTFRVVHAKCPCSECNCRQCSPHFSCACHNCRCVKCRSGQAIRPYLISFVNSFITLLIVFIDFIFDDNSPSILMLGWTTAWVSGATALVAYHHFIPPSGYVALAERRPNTDM
eukprot:TRINITY_DN10432_c0_g1_i2.p1 TRINITY_DN10432_c0_g1~~TRINITY_DN10432_c0_g1_i2.p1  ORF type:complete len:452 (+),score=36.35 TRINITY_DN10432_c0_g1_i2:243-1598(+)